MNMDRVPQVVLEAIRKVEAETGATDSRNQLLLWILTTRYGYSAAECYEFILPPGSRLMESNKASIAAMAIAEEAQGLQATILITVDGARSQRNLTSRDFEAVAGLISAICELPTESPILATPEQLLSDIATEILRANGGLRQAVIQWNIGIVTLEAAAGPVHQNLPAMSSETVSIEVLDRDVLAALASATGDPEPVEFAGSYALPPHGVIWRPNGEPPTAVIALPATDIVRWPGIEDRRLFDLNVRYGLGLNKVRRSLDDAIQDQAHHASFLASHNGITVLTSSLSLAEGSIEVGDLSVVNGAQTVEALHQNAEHLSESLEILVKFVLGVDPEQAQRLAVRSNTQNPVTTRNLKALDAVQLRLQTQLAARGYILLTKAGSGQSVSANAIDNDHMAQLLCTIYLEEPWLAVKRTVLFERQNYSRIYPETLAAERVILCQTIWDEIESHRDMLDAEYRQTWRLSALTVAFLVGQAMRSHPGGRDLLLSPDAELREGDSRQTRALLKQVVKRIVDFMNLELAAASDDQRHAFRSSFKSKRQLMQLAARARSATHTWELWGSQ